ncbi:VOC family protein [Pseudalkalibacillus berkeleyi]|uniref:VOC family protein n=1 Tax=Pseudalkalibacillus berkeleyi TaxID=1069813 RepID=A0ABS9GXT7_9BACL|nr:VOC family protein [Pseudalkalibacillus berkeleyi]MCF6136413.1 VOC family protein [Pseudalkalibacillus berkeleyi]
MSLIRVGTTYIPVRNVAESLNWYVEKLSAVKTYEDDRKAIINLADQSFFLVKADEGETANFKDSEGNEQFSLTFEVDGYDKLAELHKEFARKEIRVGEIEDRGHAGNNFVFYDLDGNKFDVWSELSVGFKENT